MVTWQELDPPELDRSNQHGWPGGDLSTSELHVVKTTCDLDKPLSPFGGV